MIFLVMLAITFSILMRMQGLETETVTNRDQNFWLSNKVFKTTAIIFSSNCPARCRCLDVKPNQYVLVACERGLDALPKTCPPKTEWLSYTHSQVDSNLISRSSLRRFAEVRILNLSNNNIYKITYDAFTDLTNLTNLYIDNNPFVSAENGQFLPSLSSSVQLLSLKNVIAPNTPDIALWNLFKNTGFRESANDKFLINLKELRLDRNNLKSIDSDAIQKSGILFKLKVLGLSSNLFHSKDLLTLLKLIKKTLLEKAKIKDLVSGKNKVIKQEENRILLIDFSYNHLSSINKTIINLLKSIFPREKSSTDKSNHISRQPKVQYLLDGNHWICTCDIVPLINILSNTTAKKIIKDWQYLHCIGPMQLTGVKIIDLRTLPRDLRVCERVAERSTIQWVFIVICSIVLTAVTVMVAYLNRHKFIFYCNFIKNCGRDQEQIASVRWRNNLDKYTIPSDLKGPVLQRYCQGENADSKMEAEEITK